MKLKDFLAYYFKLPYGEFKCLPEADKQGYLEYHRDYCERENRYFNLIKNADIEDFDRVYAECMAGCKVKG